MSAEENKAALLRAIGHWNNPSNWAGYFDFYNKNVATHGFLPGLEGLAGLQQFYSGLWAAFPDSKVTIDDLVAEGDKLAARYTFTGTHQGDFMEMPATGSPVTWGNNDSPHDWWQMCGAVEPGRHAGADAATGRY